MTAERLRVRSGEKSIIHHLALAVTCAVLIAPSLGARAADLVVWWEQGFYPQADEAVAEIVAAFEQETGKEIELVQPTLDELFDEAQAAVEAGHPPDFLFGGTVEFWAAKWAYEDRLVDLEGPLTPVQDLFDADALEAGRLLNRSTGQRGLYALPMGRASNNIHVWNSLLDRAGFTLADIPQEWNAFWSFWCDRVQPAVRKVLGRDDIWSVGLPMSVAATADTTDQVVQFQLAYEAPWIGVDPRLQLNDPEIRARMVTALEDYTAIWRKGCTPPDALEWDSSGKAFLTQTVVMTPNMTLSIPAALRRERPEDYDRNAATIDWPARPDGESLVLVGAINRAVVFNAGTDSELAGNLVRFLAEEGWLAHWLTFMGDQYMPPMRKLVDQPFWLDASDPHRMRAAMQILTRPHLLSYEVRDHESQSGRIMDENVWGKAVHRVVADGVSPEQAVDEAIARIKQILAD
jgi:multiple sugar transport system substrate-binding protein